MLATHYLFSHNLRLKKSLCAYMGFCAYEYEYTSHIVTFYNSCPQRPGGFMLHGRLLLSPSLGAERG